MISGVNDRYESRLAAQSHNNMKIFPMKFFCDRKELREGERIKNESFPHFGEVPKRWCGEVPHVTLFLEEATNMAEAYCVKCKAKRQVKDPQQVTLKNGKPALTGTCPECGRKVFKIGGKV